MPFSGEIVPRNGFKADPHWLQVWTEIPVLNTQRDPQLLGILNYVRKLSTESRGILATIMIDIRKNGVKMEPDVPKPVCPDQSNHQKKCMHESLWCNKTAFLETDILGMAVGTGLHR